MGKHRGSCHLTLLDGLDTVAHSYNVTWGGASFRCLNNLMCPLSDIPPPLPFLYCLGGRVLFGFFTSPFFFPSFLLLIDATVCSISCCK